MKFFFLSVLFLFLSASLFAQQQLSTNDKQAIKYFALANQSLDEHLYAEAITQLLKAIDEDGKFLEAHAQLGDIYRLKWQYQEAVEQYRKVISISPDWNRGVYYK